MTSVIALPRYSSPHPLQFDLAHVAGGRIERRWRGVAVKLAELLAHLPDVVIAVVVQAVRQQAPIEGIIEIEYGVFDRALWNEAQHPLNLVGIDLIRPFIEYWFGLDGDDLIGQMPNNRTDEMGDMRDRQILLADVENLPGDLVLGRRDHQQIGIDHVLDVQVRPHLRAAEDRDDALVDGKVG